MIDENRQHWKCKYCYMVGYSGGVSKLKRHLIGYRGVKKCPAVPAQVCVEIKHLMDAKKERRQKLAALKGGNNVESRSFSGDDKDKMDLLAPDSDALTGVNTHFLEEATNETNAELQNHVQEVCKIYCFVCLLFIVLFVYYFPEDFTMFYCSSYRVTLC